MALPIEELVYDEGSMRRLLLDTCIYGEMAIDSNLQMIKENYHRKKDFIVYGFSLIRKELRATSKTKLYAGMNLRVALLSIYDEFVKDKTLSIEEDKLRAVAKKYYEVYKKRGGTYSEKESLSDFLIVACAALKEMDLVVSNDHATMLSDNALSAYSLVNKELKLKEPLFISYAEFKDFLLREHGGD